MENNDDLTYEMLPPSWAFCFVDNCPKAPDCIRHISSRVIPSGVTTGIAVYPTAASGDNCPHFKQTRKIHAAWGFDTLFDEVKQKDTTALRNALKHYLGGHGTYYRYHNGEKLLSPEQQEWIINLFKKYGYAANLQFDHYRDAYDLE